MKFTEDQRQQFQTTGLLCLRGLIPKARILAVKEAVLGELARLRLYENGKWQTKKLSGISAFQVTTKIGQMLRHQPVFDEIIPKELIQALDDLAGSALAPQPHAQMLLTPPQKEAWSIPEFGWHVDVAIRDELPGIQVFVLLDDVAPQGGGTLAIRASHLARELEPTPERVLEMSGKAGDVYLMDMRVVHAPSINASKKARVMLTHRYLRNV